MCSKQWTAVETEKINVSCSVLFQVIVWVKQPGVAHVQVESQLLAKPAAQETS